MTIKNFKHVSASSLKQAIAILSKTGQKTSAVAGGTDLLGTLKDKIHPKYPEIIVDLKTIPGMNYIKEDKNSLHIGALTTLHEIATNKTINSKLSILATAARTVASPQIRNMGTIGGNICQEPRCWYYRIPDNQFNCLRKGGTKCGALLGDNRYHSIFGGVRVAKPSCSFACPGNTEIPEYMGHLRKGDIDEAAKIILRNNPLPAITGRVCPHLCESKCNRGEFDKAVSINSIERFVGDHLLDHAAELIKHSRIKTKLKPAKIAVIGAGPAGLSAAYYLRQAGHQVTVFDKMPEAGGMLTYCIPSYRLPKDIVRKQVTALEKMGIKFKLNTEIGHKRSKLSDIRKKYNCIFLATGAWKQKTLNIEKSELLTSGMEFLINSNSAKKQLIGNKILVIGGGNVAVDVAISALRLGARQVTMTCLEARDSMPAFPEDIAKALKEGINIMPSFGPHKILENNGRVTGMEVVRCTSVFDEHGHFQPSFDLSQETIIEADQIILAIGQSTDLSYAEKLIKIERGLIAVNQETKGTKTAGIFAGGDATSGPASVIEAIAAGRKAAFAIESYLNKTSSKQTDPAHMNHMVEINSELQRRSINTEDWQNLSLDEIRTEARYCINCSCVAVNASDIAPALIVLDAKIITTKRAIHAEDFFAAAQMKTTILDHNELVKEIMITPPSPHDRQNYYKFRIRNSIDFPVVSLAIVLNSKNGKLKNSRIALGAVAPTPLRLKAVECFLEDKPVTEETAAVAGELALRDIQPLAKNKFKAQIIKALFKKAIFDLSQ